MYSYWARNSFTLLLCSPTGWQASPICFSCIACENDSHPRVCCAHSGARASFRMSLTKDMPGLIQNNIMNTCHTSCVRRVVRVSCVRRVVRVSKLLNKRLRSHGYLNTQRPLLVCVSWWCTFCCAFVCLCMGDVGLWRPQLPISSGEELM